VYNTVALHKARGRVEGLCERQNEFQSVVAKRADLSADFGGSLGAVFSGRPAAQTTQLDPDQ
jgi:hypothetical protein